MSTSGPSGSGGSRPSAAQQQQRVSLARIEAAAMAGPRLSTQHKVHAHSVYFRQREMTTQNSEGAVLVGGGSMSGASPGLKSTLLGGEWGGLHGSSPMGQLVLCVIGLLLCVSIGIYMALFSGETATHRIVAAITAALCAALFALLAINASRRLKHGPCEPQPMPNLAARRSTVATGMSAALRRPRSSEPRRASAVDGAPLTLVVSPPPLS